MEPYILDRMSEANREQMQALVDSMWGTIAEAVAASRGIDVEQLNEIADKLQVTLPEDALKYGFVDGLLYEDQMKEVFAELGVEDDGEGNYNFVSLGDYASMVGVDLDNLGADRVAVVYADGQIVDGEGYGDAVYGNSLAAELADVRRDEKVKAVVVRVNSPAAAPWPRMSSGARWSCSGPRSPLSCRWAPMPPAADTTSPARLTSSSPTA